MSTREANCLSRAFHAICILGTIALIIWCIYMYVLDEDMTVIHFEKFHSKPEYIYPSISLCGSDIFYDSTLKELGASQAKYESFLKGEYFDKDIANITYHDVVSNPIDKLLGIKIYQEYGLNGNENPEHSFWYNHVQGNETSTQNGTSSFPPQWKPSFHVDNFNTWLGQIYNCMTVDVPFVTNEHSSWIQIVMNKRFFPKGIRPMSVNSGGMFMMVIGFPYQRQRYSIYTNVWPAVVTNKSYAMRFTVTGMDVIQARNTKSRPCDEEWQEYDKKAERELLTRVGCIPPYWRKKYGEYQLPLCSNSTDMKELYQDTAWFRHINPCRRIARLTTNFMEYPSIWHNKDIGPEYMDKYFAVYLYFPRATFKHIEMVRSFDIQTLIGNAGGYIGLFLGHTLLQLPGFIYYLWQKLKRLFKSENRNIQTGHKNNTAENNGTYDEKQLEARIRVYETQQRWMRSRLEK